MRCRAFSGNNRRLVCGRRQCQPGRCARIKLCIGSLLRCPFSASPWNLSTSAFPPNPPPTHLSRGFWRWRPTVSIVFFCGGRTALCVSLQTWRSAIYRIALGSRRREGGAAQVDNGQSADRWSTTQAKM